MKTNKVIRVLSLAAMMVIPFTSCNNPAGNANASSSTADSDSINGAVKIAYIEVDSLMSQYEFCKEFALILQKKATNAQNTITSKEKQLQTAATNFDKKVNNNGFASREEAEKVYANIQRQGQSLQDLKIRLASELETENNTYNKALRDSLKNFLEVYNADKKFDYILSKSGDNILLANPNYDITEEVINGLNERYKSTFKEEDKK